MFMEAGYYILLLLFIFWSVGSISILMDIYCPIVCVNPIETDEDGDSNKPEEIYDNFELPDITYEIQQEEEINSVIIEAEQIKEERPIDDTPLDLSSSIFDNDNFEILIDPSNLDDMEIK